jgi:hypothetical protein
VSLPAPEPGLVIRYADLWLREHRQGREEGTKDRPGAIVLAVQDRDGVSHVLVVPVTYTPPESPDTAQELPAAIKVHLGLDAERAWVVLSESNLFERPGPIFAASATATTVRLPTASCRRGFSPSFDGVSWRSKPCRGRGGSGARSDRHPLGRMDQFSGRAGSAISRSSNAGHRSGARLRAAVTPVTEPAAAGA